MHTTVCVGTEVISFALSVTGVLHRIRELVVIDNPKVIGGKMKKQYYVGIITGNENKIMYVTNANGFMAVWEEAAPAKTFTQARARDIAEGLFLNGYPAVVLEAPECLKLTNAATQPE